MRKALLKFISEDQWRLVFRNSSSYFPLSFFRVICVFRGLRLLFLISDRYADSWENAGMRMIFASCVLMALGFVVPLAFAQEPEAESSKEEPAPRYINKKDH